MPFDWKTPIGYIIALTLQYFGLAYLYSFTAFILSIEIGCYLLAMEFIIDIKNDLNFFNEIAKSKKNQSQLSSRLPDSIQFHIRLKQLSLSCFSILFIVTKTKSGSSIIYVYLSSNHR